MKYKDSVDILYQDNHILICVKDAPMLTQSDDTKRTSLDEILRCYLQSETKKTNPFLHPIHRLDYLVSGIVLFARSSKALKRLNEQQRERKIEKIYYALVEGDLSDEKKELVHTLEKSSYKAISSKKGKECRLRYEVIKKLKGKTLCKVTLETGRYHQIRVQFSLIGHPIVGDEKYGSKTKMARICLHHAEIYFIHPVTKKEMRFSDRSAPFLKDFL